MKLVGRRSIACAGLFAAGILMSGCSTIQGHTGYLLDQSLVATVRPGVDNKASVEKTLGHPSFVGQFTPDDWYYVERNTRQLAFGMPKPTSQTILHIHFDKAGNVASVEKHGMEQVAKIDPVRVKTPTLGRKRGFFEDLFGNIGRVGSMPSSGRPSDNTGP